MNLIQVLSRSALLLVPVFADYAQAQEKELRDFSNDLAEQIAAKGKTPVAVTSFANAEYGPSFSIFLVDRINILLVSSKRQIEVVTRDRIEEAFKEINLSLGRNYDSGTFARIGKAVGAKTLVRGSYTVMPSAAKISVTAQVLDIESGKIVGGSLVDLPYTGDLKTMLTPVEVREATGGSSAESATRSVVQQIEVHQVLFRLTSCSVTRTNVTCKLSITSPERDRRLRIGYAAYLPGTSMFDQSGNEFSLSHIVVGTRSGRTSVETLLVRDVPVSAQLTFNVTSNVSTISLLALRCADLEAGGRLDVEFRNIRP